MMAFLMCSLQCPRSKAMHSFICKGYYPSSPLSLAFAINEDVIIMFYQLNMLGPSSKKTYCRAFQHYLKVKGGPVDAPDCYRAFLGVYSTWLEVQAQVQVGIEKMISALQSNLSDLSSTFSPKEALKSWSFEEITHEMVLLSRLCPACFGSSPSPKITYIAFDGNFQHKRFSIKTHGECHRHQPSTRDLRDKCLFLPSLPPDEVHRLRAH